MSARVVIRPANHGDAERIAVIYNYYIANSVVTFEEIELSSSEIRSRINETAAEKLPYLVATKNNELIGYAYASKWKGRCAYRFTVEVTVYLDPDHTSGGIGTLLYKTLFAELNKLGYHTAIGGISLPNAGSISLHEKFGMQKVAHFKEVGFKFDQWVDVGYWQGPLVE